MWLPIRPVFADGLDSRRSPSLMLYMEWFDRVFWDWGHACMHVSCFFRFINFFWLALAPILLCMHLEPFGWNYKPAEKHC
jgi:hypothetical protein